jgi:3-dehydroquinate synthetase
MATVRVEVDPAYEVRVGTGLLAQLGEMTRLAAGGERAFVLFDRGVPTPLKKAGVASLEKAGFACTSFGFEPSERVKTMASLAPVLRAMAMSRHERGDPVVVIGGGVTGDLGGFASAIYRRGTPVVQCPTTLLAMVDASVGGKTGVNLELELGAAGAEGELLKNFVGAFHQPRLVVADVQALRSLDPRVFRCGLAECIKHAMIGAEAGDQELASWFEGALDQILTQREDALIELVERNVRVKSAIVAGDVQERKADGGRALLNLGHTFGHAIETIPHLSPTCKDGDADAPLMHGEAVGLGLIASATVSRRLGLLTSDGPGEIVERCGLPTRVAGLPEDEEVLGRMGHDKKVLGGKLRLVLPTDGASAVVRDDVPADAIVEGLGAIRAG